MNDQINQFMSQHWLALLIAYWLFSNFVSTMPTPNGDAPTNTWWYKWLFGALHGLVGSLGRVTATMGTKLLKPTDEAKP